MQDNDITYKTKTHFLREDAPDIHYSSLFSMKCLSVIERNVKAGSTLRDFSRNFVDKRKTARLNASQYRINAINVKSPYAEGSE
jgi:hypothetical protein